MKIAALQKTTLIDFPAKLACIVFLFECNFRCPFCHSAELVLENRSPSFVSEEEFFNFLRKRKGQLDGVVLCGGEPTLQKDLAEFCSRIKRLGFLVKLDTNGSNPEMLKKLIQGGLIDYVALDIKTSKEKYPEAIAVPIENIAQKVEQAVEILKQSDVDYELRTTCVPGIVAREDIASIGKWLGPAKKYFLQYFKPQKTLDPAFGAIMPYSDQEMQVLLETARRFFPKCSLR